MRYIYRGQIRVNEVLIDQEYDEDIHYRWANWCVIKKTDNEEVAVYNIFTRCVIILSTKEYNTSCFEEKTCKNLVKGYFLVPMDFHEKTFIKMFLAAYEKQKPRPGILDPTTFVILSTTMCNAKCYYCYESNYNKINMTKETADKVIDFIVRSARGREISILWFGGEPLYNVKIIKYISEGLLNEGLKFTSSAISNGSLVTSIDNIEELIKLINLQRIQITLDGTEKIYEEIKGVKFEDTLNGINFLLSQEIKVTVRMNLSNSNFEDLKNLIYFLKEKFGNSKDFSIYPYPLFQLTVDQGGDEEIYDNFIELSRISYELNLNSPKCKEISSNHCMADSGKTVVISPTGELSLCEHYCEGNEIFGSIDGGIKNYNYKLISKWREKGIDIDECDECPYYAQCLRLKKCPTSTICTRGYRKYREFEAEAFIDRILQNERSRKDRKI